MPEASVVIVANNLMSGDYQAWHLNKLSHNSSCGQRGTTHRTSRRRSGIEGVKRAASEACSESPGSFAGMAATVHSNEHVVGVAGYKVDGSYGKAHNATIATIVPASAKAKHTAATSVSM